MLKALYNKIKSYLLCVKTNINNIKYNCKIYFQTKTNVETLNYSLYTIKYYIQYTILRHSIEYYDISHYLKLNLY